MRGPPLANDKGYQMVASHLFAAPGMRGSG
jgi:hypothetical protein